MYDKTMCNYLVFEVVLPLLFVRELPLELLDALGPRLRIENTTREPLKSYLENIDPDAFANVSSSITYPVLISESRAPKNSILFCRQTTLNMKRLAQGLYKSFELKRKMFYKLWKQMSRLV